MRKRRRETLLQDAAVRTCAFLKREERLTDPGICFYRIKHLSAFFTHYGICQDRSEKLRVAEKMIFCYISYMDFE